MENLNNKLLNEAQSQPSCLGAVILSLPEQLEIFLKIRAEQYNIHSSSFTEGWKDDWSKFLKILNDNGYFISKAM